MIQWLTIEFSYWNLLCYPFHPSIWIIVDCSNGSNRNLFIVYIRWTQIARKKSIVHHQFLKHVLKFTEDIEECFYFVVTYLATKSENQQFCGNMSDDGCGKMDETTISIRINAQKYSLQQNEHFQYLANNTHLFLQNFRKRSSYGRFTGSRNFTNTNRKTLEFCHP